MRTELVAILLSGTILGCVALATPVSATTPPSPPLKQVALTFDDGPYGAPTVEILNTLEGEHVPATFFLIGRNVEEYPELAKREAADGDLIGNHTEDHSITLASSTAEAFKADLDKAAEIIASTTGVRTTFFRPPYGNMSETMREVLRKEGYKTVMWNDDARDWDFSGSPTETVVSRILSQVKPDSIIVLHDGRDTRVGYPRSNTVNAVRIIIADLKKEGYTFVTVDKLIH
ncbi:MAG: hypothetical protein RLZZ26_526 [Candidatus Parcubacteria bacterium]|jgi:chitin deacetylase